MTTVQTSFVRGAGGCRIAVHRLGEGPPVILVHGFISSANTNWIAPGTARQLVEAGFSVIAPDLRGHGLSDAPQDEAAYPADVLPADIEAVIDALGLQDYDLAGYSLGARTALRLVTRRMAPTPRRLILGGMGLSGMLSMTSRRDWFIQAIERRDEPGLGGAERMVARFLKAMGTDPVAAIHVLNSQVDNSSADLAAISVPTLVVCGAADDENGSAPDLARAIPGAVYAAVPGTHMSAVLDPGLGRRLVAFLTDG